MNPIRAAALLLATSVAPAVAADLTLTTAATTGSDSRPVRMSFGCSTNDGPNLTGALSVELLVPDASQLKPTFDFDPFEGPDADQGLRTRLRATTRQGSVEAKFVASGGYTTYGPGEAFRLGVNAAMRQDRARLKSLATILRPLTTGSGRLLWTQSNAKPGGTAINAALATSTDDAERLRALLAPCLAASG